MPTFDTIRCCPYHGGWIKLADCPIVATNMGVVLGFDQPQAVPGLGSLAAQFGATVTDDDELPPLGSPIGPQHPAGATATATEIAVGKDLVSRIDGKARRVVALAPKPPAKGAQKKRFLTPKSQETPDQLPSPADLAIKVGGSRARPLRACPDPRCLHPLPATIDHRDPISIAVIGNTGASKTTTMAAFLYELRRQGPEVLGVPSFTASEDTRRTMRPIVDAYEQGDDTERTHGQRFHAPLEFNTVLRGLDVTVLLHDVAGETVMDPYERLQWAPHVLWADVLLFIYNPEESPSLSSSLNHVRSAVDQAGVLDGVLDDFDTHQPRQPDNKTPRERPPLVVAVSKADRLTAFPRIHGPGVEGDVKRTLRELYDADIVHSGDRWDNTHWRFIAPKPPSGGPEGVMDLFRLLLQIAIP